MQKEIPALALILLVLATSGCAAILDVIQDKCEGVSCGDQCSGDTRLYSGICKNGECGYVFELCEHGCSQGECNRQPSHLVIGDNEQKKGNFSLAIIRTEVSIGDEKKDEKDSYDFYLGISNDGDSGSIFSIKGASIVAETGIMHSSVGFSWSEFIAGAENKNISFSIGEVPPSLREQNTTVVIRTNQGHYYFEASFKA